MLVSGTACWKGLAMKEKAQEIWRPHLVEANTLYEVGTGPSPNLGSCLLPACHAGKAHQELQEAQKVPDGISHHFVRCLCVSTILSSRPRVIFTSLV